jgi:hypothetical protein
MRTELSQLGLSAISILLSVARFGHFLPGLGAARKERPIFCAALDWRKRGRGSVAVAEISTTSLPADAYAALQNMQLPFVRCTLNF